MVRNAIHCPPNFSRVISISVNMITIVLCLGLFNSIVCRILFSFISRPNIRVVSFHCQYFQSPFLLFSHVWLGLSMAIAYFESSSSLLVRAYLRPRGIILSILSTSCLDLRRAQFAPNQLCGYRFETLSHENVSYFWIQCSGVCF